MEISVFPHDFDNKVNKISKSVFVMTTFSAQELEKDLHGPAADSLPSEKKLVIFDKIFTAYHEARSCIRSDLVWVIVMIAIRFSSLLLV